MYWKSIGLQGFIPFTHCGNTSVEIEFVSPATAFLGTNGCGKSSLLRAMTPYPATRTDFLKNGRISKVFEHGGHVFELTSDFSKLESPHSFLMDGAELNVGGTTEAQRDLVEEYLGYNLVMEGILSGTTHITELAKGARKQLFSAIYPSDLSFVLEYHKKVCSQIRAFANQIKLLQQREGTLTASLIDPYEREQLEKFRDGALNVIDRIDKVNLLLESEIERLQALPAYKKPYHEFDMDEVLNEFDSLRIQYRQQFLDIDRCRRLGEEITHEALRTKYTSFYNEANYLRETMRREEERLGSLRDEINKFSNLKNSSASEKKDELTKEIEVIKKELEFIQSKKEWLNTPSIPMHKLVDVVEILPKIQTYIAELHDYAGCLLSNEKITSLRTHNDKLAYSIRSLTQEREGQDKTLAQVKARREVLERNSYPLDCSRVCGLRATLDASLRDVKLRQEQIETRIKEIDAQIKQNEETIASNNTTLSACEPAMPVMRELWNILGENYLNEIALRGEEYVSCLNNHAAEISNRITLAVQASKKFYRYKELNDRYTNLQRTISAMETVEAAQMSANVIAGIIRDKQAQLDAGIAEYSRLKTQLGQLDAWMEQTGDVGRILKRVDELISEVETAMNIKILKNRIEFNREMIKQHQIMKIELSTKLRDIEHTLQEQRRITDILQTEIKPTLDDIRRQKIKWETVEQGLSPSKGLPCIYLTRFINRLISRINNYIKEVWCYDMELMYVEESDDLDFTLPVLMNKSTIVKDVGVLSKGQSAMVDLAFVLAVAAERGWLKQYPLCCDEIDAGFQEMHRTKLVELLGRLLENEDVTQMFLVNHYAIQSGFSDIDIVCLSSEGIVLPGAYNLHCTIK